MLSMPLFALCPMTPFVCYALVYWPEPPVFCCLVASPLTAELTTPTGLGSFTVCVLWYCSCPYQDLLPSLGKV